MLLFVARPMSTSRGLHSPICGKCALSAVQMNCRLNAQQREGEWIHQRPGAGNCGPTNKSVILLLTRAGSAQNYTPMTVPVVTTLDC